MGLKKKTGQIATTTGLEILKKLGSSMTTQNSQQAGASSNFSAEIIRANSPTEYVVKDAQGNDKTITYLGDRPLGVNSTLFVVGDFAF